MVEKAKKHKKSAISEEDVSILLQRYSATTVLQLLKEVAQVPNVKIDWNALVKKTTTGISNAREYQMLWRHLAYHNNLIERLDDGVEPLDDDSDLEYELEAFPSVSDEASTEAAAYVKVLTASGVPSDSNLPKDPNSSTIEASLTINIPCGPPSRGPSENSRLGSFMQGTNINVPVSVQNLPVPVVTSAEGLDTNGSAIGSLPARRKRKPWSAAEDMELISAVQKCGEGNWANILKGDFKGDRTASQLSQRWAIIRKRQANLNVGGSSQLTESQLATRRAMFLALSIPMVENLKAACSNGWTNSNTASYAHPTAPEPFLGGAKSQQSQQGFVSTTTQGIGTPGSLSKFRVTSRKTSTNSTLTPDDMVKAAAVAAGARIVTPSDATSLLRAAQPKNAVHIMSGGGTSVKSSVVGSANPLPSSHLGAHRNVHRVLTGQAVKPLSTCPLVPPNGSRLGGTQQVQSHFVKSEVAVVQRSALTNGTKLGTLPEITFEVEAKTAEDNIENQVIILGNTPKDQVQENQVFVSSNAPKDRSQEDQALISGNVRNRRVQEDQTTLLKSESTVKCKMDFVENLESLGAETAGNKQIIGNPAAENETTDVIKSTVRGIENQSVAKGSL